MKVKDIMKKKVQIMKPQDTLQSAAKKMKTQDLGCIFVSEKDRLVGIVTDRDIILRALTKESNLKTLKLKDVMTKKVLYCFEGDSLKSAAENMAKNQIRRLPVLNKTKKLVGVLSIGNIAQHSETDAGKAMKKICKKKK
jgi:CBS domain-containing protein